MCTTNFEDYSGPCSMHWMTIFSISFRASHWNKSFKSKLLHKRNRDILLGQAVEFEETLVIKYVNDWLQTSKSLPLKDLEQMKGKWN